MKKYLAITALFLLAFSGIAMAETYEMAFADRGKSIQGEGKATVTIVKMSTNVLGSAEYSTTGYSIATYHTNGTKVYGTSYDATALYYKDVQANYVPSTGTLAAPSSSVAAEAFDTTWTKM